jgi:hypothetical protein
VAALLTACTGDVTTQSYSYRGDVPGYQQYAAATGPVPVAVYNSPFDAGAVIAAMQGHNPGPKLTFTAASASAAAYRIVLVFGESHAAPSTYCEAQTVTGGPSPNGRLTVTAAFCNGGRILSDAVARTNEIGSAQDPEFTRLMSDLLSALLPQNDPVSASDIGGGSGM